MPSSVVGGYCSFRKVEGHGLGVEINERSIWRPVGFLEVSSESVNRTKSEFMCRDGFIETNFSGIELTPPHC